MKKQLVVFLLVTMGVTGCSSLGQLTGFGEDNTPKPAPLVEIKEEYTPQVIWATQSGSGAGDQYLPLRPVITQDQLIVAHYNGKVVAHQLTDGRTIWQATLNQPISSNLVVVANYVIVGTANAKLVVLDKLTGAIKQEIALPNRAIAINQLGAQRLVVKTLNGQVLAVDPVEGEIIWQYQHKVPTLVLRNSSQPQVVDDCVIVGFADGKIVALDAEEGKLLWERLLALPQGPSEVEQMVDIPADPIIVDNTVYVANYQGNLTAIELETGQIQWQFPFSGYAGLTAQEDRLYAINTEDEIWAIQRHKGKVDWRQVDFSARGLTAPVIVGNTLVVGDKEGYLHWLALQDGRQLARLRVSKEALLAQPVVRDNVIYLVTARGHAAAVRI